jgi:hypothetical protein
MRVFWALVALALQATTAQSIFSLDAAFQILVTAQQPWVAPQLPTGGDVSTLKPMPKAACSSVDRVTTVYRRKHSKAAPKSGLCKGYLWLLGAILIEPIISRKMAIS